LTLGASRFWDRATASTPQQEHLKACNAQAWDKKGDERKAFMAAASRPTRRCGGLP